MIKKRISRKIQTPPGLHDILPEAFAYFRYIRQKSENLAQAYDFLPIETPILEYADLFLRTLGASSDIVQKEMYTLRTKGGDYLALRPEGTAPLARAYLQHGMASWPQPVKLWYFGPMFRHDRPQRGRFREFWQVGYEILGEDDPVADAELIQIITVLLKELGLKSWTLQLNSVGDSQCRPYYKKVLTTFYRSRIDRLCRNCQRRLKENPLRLLDCKEERCLEVRQGAPQFVDHLDEDCRKHFKQVLEFLEEVEIPYLVNFYLVRGLDYYTRTVFEIFPEITDLSETKAEAQPSVPLAIAAGGRYDDLLKRIGGKATPAAGGALGIERILEELQKQKVKVSKAAKPEVFFAQLGDLAKKRSLKLFEEFRKAGIHVKAVFGKESIKSQLKVADKLGLPLTLIFGQKEALEGTIIIRQMRDGTQVTIPIEKVIPELKERLRKLK